MPTAERITFDTERNVCARVCASSGSMTQLSGFLTNLASLNQRSPRRNCQIIPQERLPTEQALAPVC